MKKISGIVVLIVVVAAVWGLLPRFYSRVDAGPEQFTEWTSAFIEEDPFGYSSYCERRFKLNLARLEERRDSLGRVNSALENRLTEKISLNESGRSNAEEIARTYEKGVFPATINGASYTREQLKDQLNLTLAQVDGLQRLIDDMSATSQQAREGVQQFTALIKRTETLTATIDSKRENFKVKNLTDEDKSTLEQCRIVLEETKTTLASDFSQRRMIEQLFQESEKTNVSSSDARVEEYLQEFRTREKQAEQTCNFSEEPVEKVE